MNPLLVCPDCRTVIKSSVWAYEGYGIGICDCGQGFGREVYPLSSPGLPPSGSMTDGEPECESLGSPSFSSIDWPAAAILAALWGCSAAIVGATIWWGWVLLELS